ncbi:AraC family transcriptional regulator [Ferruginibacter lapsinanis]|uniref:helix-turn-helix transcriptional regulator n=1 Tax=Ferruginibacter lapsinanis TaxID=563172 RepID=UPI001E282D18|nr:AraC family transcriptional regulator [Ferruginibacter lapsinanis]UEG49928.1 AraC family transcriptional regulator [Ferruginibacter lapsinanis]
MVVFNIDHTNYKKLISDLASVLGLTVQQEDLLIISDPVGSGMIKVFSLFDELEVLLIDAVFYERLITIREKSDNRYYILHFDNIAITDATKFTVGEEQLQKTNTHHSVARLTSNIFLNKEEIPANTRIRSVKILFNKKWLKKYLHLDSDADVLQKYLSLKTESFDIEKLDDEYQKLLDDLWRIEKDDPMKNIFLQNRVSLLVERFFSRLYSKMDLLEGKFNLTEDEVRRLVKVQQLLVSNFSEQPPTIDEFSKLASMSVTKLKKNFKDIYGDSIYAYYQKIRLQKARELLATGKYNVKETAEAIGYANPSNFINAFKKQYKELPGDIVAKDAV